MTERYVLKLHKMTKTSDDVFVVPGWSCVIERDNLPKIELALAADLLDVSLKNFTATLEPMDDDDIREWREGEND